jgi:Flp pilus assembly pilin Flp
MIMENIRNLVKDTKGANMVEYIILVGVIAVIAIMGFNYFGDKVDKTVRGQGEAVERVGNLSDQAQPAAGGQ